MANSNQQLASAVNDHFGALQAFASALMQSGHHEQTDELLGCIVRIGIDNWLTAVCFWLSTTCTRERPLLYI